MLLNSAMLENPYIPNLNCKMIYGISNRFGGQIRQSSLTKPPKTQI